MLRSWHKFFVFAAKGFQQNLVYLASHLINTVASALFGIIYIYLWLAVIPADGFAEYSLATMTAYIIFNQTACWLTQFGMRIHARIAEAVRSGNIATELARPVDYFYYRMSTEFGSQAYSFLFRGVPCGIMLLPFGMYFPQSPATYLYTLVSLVIGGYISLALDYMVGISAFWTTEIRTAHWVNISLKYTLGGVSIPLDVFPYAMYLAARITPYAYLNYHPARIYLGLSGPLPIVHGLAWAIAVTILAKLMTRAARRKLEVQGG